jgi:hypothetical protein
LISGWSWTGYLTLRRAVGGFYRPLGTPFYLGKALKPSLLVGLCSRVVITEKGCDIRQFSLLVKGLLS